MVFQENMLLFLCQHCTPARLQHNIFHVNFEMSAAVSIAAELTWVFPSLVPLDEADNEEDQDEQGDGTHQADEPSLSSDVHLSAGHGWPKRGERKTQCL